MSSEASNSLTLAETIAFLESIGQSHLTVRIDSYSEEEKQEFVDQINKLNSSYPGGLREYTSRAKILLANSANDVNPYADYDVSVPNGQTINFSSLEEVAHYERIGRQELTQTAFVLVAGGLGERLNYNGIKIGIEFELTTGQTFLEYYLSFIRAFSESAELAIMTSDDTYSKTIELLREHQNFGFPSTQITILKQEKVAAMIDNDARFAQIPNSLLIDTKPHGHGDVHTLLHQHGLPERWLKQGKKWMSIFQDTNPLVFRALPCALAVSKLRNLEVNSITAPRKPGEAVGAICKLKSTKTDESLTINVEYNQLSSLLSNEPVDELGYSVFPGNINSLVFSLEEYNQTLTRTKGLIMEFINPKYADATKTKFKSSSRLECMYQEYPKLLDNDLRVGTTQVNRGFCFSTVKNDIVTAATKFAQNLAPESAATCEADFYAVNRAILRLTGGLVEEDAETTTQEFAGIKVNLFPQVVLHPSLGVTIEEIKQTIGGRNLSITKQSSVVIDKKLIANHTTELAVDGQLNLPESLTTHGSKYKVLIPTAADAKQHLLIRGYTVLKQLAVL